MDNGLPIEVTCNTWPSGSWPTLGGRGKTCSATDASGNTATCSFYISVIGEYRMKDLIWKLWKMLVRFRVCHNSFHDEQQIKDR